MEHPFQFTRRDAADLLEWRLGSSGLGLAFDTKGRRPLMIQAAGLFHGAILRWETSLAEAAPFETAKTTQGLPAVWSGGRLAALEGPVGLVRPRVEGGTPETEVKLWLLVSH